MDADRPRRASTESYYSSDSEGFDETLQGRCSALLKECSGLEDEITRLEASIEERMAAWDKVLEGMRASDAEAVALSNRVEAARTSIRETIDGQLYSAQQSNSKAEEKLDSSKVELEKTKKLIDELYEQMKVLHAKVASEEATAQQVVKTKSAFSCFACILAALLVALLAVLFTDLEDITLP